MGDILELQQAFDDAELRADASRLASLLADDFLSIGEQGYQLDKRQWIGRHGDFRYLSIETSARGALIAEVSSQPTLSYEPITVPLTGAGPSVHRCLMVDTNSPNAGSAASGL
jgi:hypothetical protein